MDKFLISGPCKIKGQVSISASKNAALPILASTLLFDKPVVIENLPKVRDIDTMLNLLKSLGSKIEFSNNSRNNNLGYIIKNSKFFLTLNNILLKKKNVIFIDGIKLNKINYAINSVEGYFNNLKIGADLIIAADGKKSAVRK